MEKVAPNLKFVGHFTEIIQQSKIKGPLPFRHRHLTDQPQLLLSTKFLNDPWSKRHARPRDKFLKPLLKPPPPWKKEFLRLSSLDMANKGNLITALLILNHLEHFVNYLFVWIGCHRVLVAIYSKVPNKRTPYIY